MNSFNVILYAFGGLIMFCIVVWLILRWKLRIYYERFKNVKTIPGLPLPIGHAHLFIGKKTRGIYKYVDVMLQKYGNQPVNLWLGPFPIIFIANVLDVHAVLTSPHGLQKNYVLRFMQNKTGLVTAPVELWRHSRKMLNPTFNFKMIQSFIPIFNKCSAKLIRNWQKNSNGELFDCGEEIFLTQLSIACFTTLGFDMDLQEYDYSMFHEVLLMSRFVIKRIPKIWQHPDFIYNQTKDGKKFNKMVTNFFHMTTDIMQSKKAEYNAMTQEEKSAIFDEDNTKKPKIFLTQIFHMAQENNLSDEYIREQVDTMIMAGSETSAATVSFTTLVLAMYPDIQQRVYQEILEVTNGSEYINYEMISKLNYTEMVIKETLRLYPVAPYLLREATGDITISNCTIPKHTNILISIYHLHRDKRIWGPEANIFNPNNFLPEKIRERHSASFIPFSYGPRNCIAMRYAMMSMKVSLCHLLLKYKFATPLKPTDLKFDLTVTLQLMNGFMVRMTPRHN